jgi:K+-sensing histidine kinase KdpD
LPRPGGIFGKEKAFSFRKPVIVMMKKKRPFCKVLLFCRLYGGHLRAFGGCLVSCEQSCHRQENVLMVLLVGVLLVTVLTNVYFYGALASLFSVLLFNFFLRLPFIRF